MAALQNLDLNSGVTVALYLGEGLAEKNSTALGQVEPLGFEVFESFFCGVCSSFPLMGL